MVDALSVFSVLHPPAGIHGAACIIESAVALAHAVHPVTDIVIMIGELEGP